MRLADIEKALRAGGHFNCYHAELDGSVDKYKLTLDGERYKITCKNLNTSHEVPDEYYTNLDEAVIELASGILFDRHGEQVPENKR